MHSSNIRLTHETFTFCAKKIVGIYKVYHSIPADLGLKVKLFLK